jgi:PBP1b-binding outer membrane lipoprotein LpoB
MKKLITIALALMLIGVLLGCTENTSTTETPSADDTTVNVPADDVPAEVSEELDSLVNEDETIDVGEII